jgi:hypothetical protein
MTRSIPNLLRRTISIAGAVLALAFAGTAPAAQIVLSGQSQLGTCSFSGQLTVNPDGSLTVTCSGGTTGAVFTLLAPAQLNINTTGNTQTTVSRSGGSGALSVNYNITGAGCTNTGGTLQFPDAASPPQPISITTAGAPGACVVAITPSSGIATPSSASINVVDPNAGSGGGVQGCPTSDPNALAVNVRFNNWLGQTQLSGLIGYTTVPVPLQTSKASVMYDQSIGTTTASAMRTEISVSKCPGVIDSSVPQCYLSSDNTLDNRLTIYTKPVFNWNSQAALGSRGCWAPASEGPWYLNYRWTYSGCAYGSCGFVMQWFNGPY